MSASPNAVHIEMWLGHAGACSRVSDSDGPCPSRPARRRPPQRPHQPRRDREDVPDRGGAAGPGPDPQGGRARGRPDRERALPAPVTVYYAVPLALYTTAGTREVLRCLLEGLRWLWGAEAVRVAGKSGISQARSRLGEAPLRRLYERVVRPVATPATKGAWYRAWRLVSLDGSCL